MHVLIVVIVMTWTGGASITSTSSTFMSKGLCEAAAAGAIEQAKEAPSPITVRVSARCYPQGTRTG